MISKSSKKVLNCILLAPLLFGCTNPQAAIESTVGTNEIKDSSKVKSSGWLIFVAGYQKCDVFAIRPNGMDRRLFAHIVGNVAEVSWSTDGRQIAFIEDETKPSPIFVASVNGSNRKSITDGRTIVSQITWSPDGKRIAYMVLENPKQGVWSIHSIDADGKNERKLSSTGSSDSNPAWSPDGKTLVFQSTGEKNTSYIASMDSTDGSGRKKIVAGAEIDCLPAFSPDGSQIAFWTSHGSRSMNIWVMHANGTSLTPVTRHSGNREAALTAPQWSPDGKYISFTSPLSTGKSGLFLTDMKGEEQLVTDELIIGHQQWWHAVELPEQPKGSMLNLAPDRSN